MFDGSGTGWRMMWCAGSGVVMEWWCVENCDAKICWIGNVCLRNTF